MAYTVAITNQKGGVGKTTTAVNLAAALAIAERRTLLVDADPQGNTTSGVGIAKLELQVSLYDALVDEHPVHDVILPVPGLRHLSLLPATQDLVGAELQLVERPFRESALRRVLEPLASEYDYVVVDCPPSLGLLTLNVLAAVQQLIIPIQCEYYGLEGISQLLNTVRLVQQNINPGLAIGGVLLTMYDSRLNLCRQVAEDATEYFGPKVFGTPIPRNVRLAEAPSFGKPILLYDMQSVGAKSYLAVAQELLRRVEGTDVTIAPAQVAAATAVAPTVSPTGSQDTEPRETEPEAGGADAPSTAGETPETEARVDAEAGVDTEAQGAGADVANPSTAEAPELEAPTPQPYPADAQLAETPTAETQMTEIAAVETAAQAISEEVASGEGDSSAAQSNAVPPNAPSADHAGVAQELDVDSEESVTVGSSPEQARQAEQDAPAAAISAPLAEPEAPPDESADDEASRRSPNASEPRPEVTT